MISVTGDRVAVLPMDDPDKIGSLWIPETAKQRIDQGIVVYKGPEVKDVFIGNHVFFGGYAGTKVSIEGEGTFVILSEDQIQCVLVSDDKDPILPLSEVLRLIDKAGGEANSKFGSVGRFRIDDVVNVIRAHFEGHFFSEGLDF